MLLLPFRASSLLLFDAILSFQDLNVSLLAEAAPNDLELRWHLGLLEDDMSASLQEQHVRMVRMLLAWFLPHAHQTNSSTHMPLAVKCERLMRRLIHASPSALSAEAKRVSHTMREHVIDWSACRERHSNRNGLQSKFQTALRRHDALTA